MCGCFLEALNNMRKIISIIILLGVMNMFLCGCSVEVEDAGNENPYSRENVKSFCESVGFGYGMVDDDQFTVAEYIYHSKNLADKYGDDFEIDDLVGSNEGEKLQKYYKARGEYQAEIKGDTWIVQVEKSYRGKWKVIDCYPEGDTEKEKKYDWSTAMAIFNDKTPLKKENIDTRTAEKIIELSNRAMLSSTKIDIKLEDMTGKYKIPIKQIKRAMKKNNHVYYYTTYECEDYSVYVFFSGSPDDCVDNYNLDLAIAASNVYDESKFSNLKGATLEDVKAIDPLTDQPNSQIFYSENDSGEALFFDKSTIHMSKDGVIYIGYEKKNGKFIVSYVSKIKNALIASIDRVDL